MTRFKLMSRLTVLAAVALLAIAALASASAQQQPPHRFYGNGFTAGDEIGAVVSHGDHYDAIGTATVDADGEWYIDVEGYSADEVEFTLNGEHANATTVSQGADLTQVTSLVVPEPEPEPEPMPVDCPEDSMSEDSMGEDSMSEDSMSEDSMGEDSMDAMAEDCPEDAMGEDSMGEDSMGEDAMGEDSMDEDKMLDDELKMPYTGSGGLADNGGISAGLLGLLIAIGAVAITGLGLRRVRNRA